MLAAPRQGACAAYRSGDMRPADVCALLSSPFISTLTPNSCPRACSRPSVFTCTDDGDRDGIAPAQTQSARRLASSKQRLYRVLSQVDRIISTQSSPGQRSSLHPAGPRHQILGTLLARASSQCRCRGCLPRRMQAHRHLLPPHCHKMHQILVLLVGSAYISTLQTEQMKLH